MCSIRPAMPWAVGSVTWALGDHDAAVDYVEEALAIADRVGLGAVAPVEGALCDLILLPFVVLRRPAGPALEGHALRTNPLAEALALRPRVVRILFQCADGYVSPSVYAEKKRSGEVVPTWNYVAAQLYGRMERLPDGELERVLGEQTLVYETRAGSSWRLEDAPPAFRTRLMGAVCPLRFVPERSIVHRKLSQNRPGERDAVRNWLDAPPPAWRSIARWMETPEGEFPPD